ncbi:MAG: hypothetical protein JST68_05600 [Bacteroidetes bacterium]|nr:hypothetical protein [Bacteroidota bacterium]
MKHLSMSLTATLALLILGSCKKDCNCPKEDPLPKTRTIEYRLYTKENFSTDNHEITFRVYFRSNHGYGTKLFDSTLQTMLISQVPDQAHQIVIHKTVPAGFETDTLTAGFIYYIKDVGESWFLDTIGPRTANKIIDYNFR